MDEEKGKQFLEKKKLPKVEKSIEFFERKEGEKGKQTYGYFDCKSVSSPIVWEKKVECPIIFTSNCETINESVYDEKKSDEKEQLVRNDEVEPYVKEKEMLTTQMVRPEKIKEETEDEKKEKAVSNYEIRPMEKTCYIDKDGKEIQYREEILCEIIIAEGLPQYFSILTKDIRRITGIISDRFSSAIINYRNKDATKVIENRFREDTRNIPRRVCYVDYGWQKIHGKYVYLHDGWRIGDFAEVKTGLNLPSYEYGKTEVANVFLDAYGLYEDKGVIGTMIAFSLLGVMYQLFEEAGYPPQFLLFINGKTGSMKTTLAKLLFVQLADDVHRDTPRRIDSDTSTSFERGIVLNGRDTVTLIDDYSPAKTQRQRREREEKLEAVIRMVGDRSTKNRSDSNLADCRGEGVKGVVVITGELMGHGLSSRLRCVYCGMEREGVNTELVTKFQKAPNRYNTFIQHFAIYVSQNWNNLRQMIILSFENQRKELGKQLRERRLIDSTATLNIICDVLENFLNTYCEAEVWMIVGVLNEMRKGITLNAIISESISCEETPAVTFMKAVEALLQANELIIEEAKIDDCDYMNVDGFADASYIYFVPERLYKSVKRLFQASNMYYPLDLQETVVALCDEGIIKPRPNGLGKKTYYTRLDLGNGRKRNFLKISKSKILEIAEL